MTRLAAALAKVLAVLTVVCVVALAFLPIATAQASGELAATGAGPVAIGLTVDELVSNLPDRYQISEELQLAPGLRGHSVQDDGRLSGFFATSPESEAIDLIIVADPALRTADGVGTGSTLAEAEAVYGEAVVSWDPAQNGMEVVAFENGPASFTFVTSPSGGPRAGIYRGDALSTNVYKPDAGLVAVWIDCRGGCPTESPVAVESEAGIAAAEAAEQSAEESQAASDDHASDDQTGEAQAKSATAQKSGPEELPKTGSATPFLILIAVMLLCLGGVARIDEIELRLRRR